MNFLDTNVLLKFLDHIEDYVPFTISSVTIEELEEIKTNKNKTEDLRFSARKATHWLIDHESDYTVAIYDDSKKKILDAMHLLDTPDNKILASFYYQFSLVEDSFFTCDLLCRLIAKSYFNYRTSYVFDSNVSNYSGFKEVCFQDSEMAYFYEHLNENIQDLAINQYIIIKDKNGNIVDNYRWDGEKHQQVFKKAVKSVYFDKLKPKDNYQVLAVDSLMNNTITAITGKAGSGKSLLSLMVAMHLIESGKYDRLVILFNPTKTRGASDMGFYAGEAIDKALQNSIGQILTTKFGDRYAVDVLISQNKLKLVSMADCRGMEINDNEILWITEAQNTSIDLIKLCLSRVSSGSKVFIEGDYLSQVDSSAFENAQNGLKRMIEVFKNHEEFGYVQLQNVWRSKIAELCELL